MFALAAFAIALLASALFATTVTENTLAASVAGAIFGFASIQLGFVGHDLGHLGRRIPSLQRRWLNLFVWNIALGISYSWWADKHFRHHRCTNIIGQDPDLYSLYVYDPATAARADGLKRIWFRNQWWKFWVMTSVAKLYFQALSLGYLISQRRKHHQRELLLLLLHYTVLVSVLLPANLVVICSFLAASYAVAGIYMGLVFAPNHLALPHPKVAPTGRMWQVAATRNIRCGAVGDLLFGGLNYQIEHHIFPGVPHWQLPKLVGTARSKCVAAGVPYTETSIWRAYRDVTRHLWAVGRGTR
jgi:fatty acid desaturase